MAVEGLELKLRSELSSDRDDSSNVYNIVATKPVITGELVHLYLARSDFSQVIASAEASDLDLTIVDLFEKSIEHKSNEEGLNYTDHLGWPANFVSFGFVESGGNALWGYENFVGYPVPVETMLKFAQLYTNRVLRAEIAALPEDDELGRRMRERGIRE